MHLKYSGSYFNVNQPQLVINNVDKEDAGKYKLEVISPKETKSSTDISLHLYGGKQK
jgi:cAMP phosphodiesterase